MLRRVSLIVVALVLLVFVVPWALSKIFASDAVLIEIDEVEVQAPAHGSSQLKIGAFNIAHGRGLSSSNWTEEPEHSRWMRLVEIGELISRSDLDVVVLNEVDFDAQWSYGADQAQQIALAGNYRYVAEVPNLHFRIGPVLFRFGNAVLSRFPLRDVEVIDLPAYSGLEELVVGKKCGIAVTVETPTGSIRIFGVHLSHRSETVRAASARHLIELADRCELPVIIAGDTNSTPTGFPGSQHGEADENAMDILFETDRWIHHPVELPGSEEMTFHSARPRAVIDWILIPREWSFESYQVIGSELSDHGMVVAATTSVSTEKK